MEKFKIFLSHAGRFLPGQSLPVHFQEAALVLATEDLSVLDWVSIRPEIVQRYKQFQKDILKIKNGADGCLGFTGNMETLFGFIIIVRI